MKLKFNATFSVAIAMGFGIVVLLGYFFGANAAGDPNTLGVLRDYLLQGAIILSAVALLVGIGNLSAVHMKKIRKGEEGGYSFILLLSMIITLGIGIWDIVRTYMNGELTFTSTLWIFDNIQLPIETSLMAVLAVSLTYAAARLLGRRMTVFSVIFIGTVLLIFIGSIPQFADIGAFSWIRNTIVNSFAVAGARGILLGVALGSIATGIRVLMGSDRPYGG